MRQSNLKNTMKLQHRALLSAAISVICLGTMNIAHANSFNVQVDATAGYDFFQGFFGAPAMGTPVSASLVITTAGDASSFQAVTGISGTIFGQTVTGLGGDGGLGWGPVNQFTANAPYLNDFGIFLASATETWRIVNWGYSDIQILNLSNHWSTNSGAINVSALAAAPTAPVPEPETYAMLMAGLGVLGAMSRRQKKQAGCTAVAA
jgi:hypothetical protein